MMKLFEACSCILHGVGTDKISSELLSSMPVTDRGDALMWISDHLDKCELLKSEYGALESLLQKEMRNDESRNSNSEAGKAFFVLQELRNLLLNGAYKKAA